MSGEQGNAYAAWDDNMSQQAQDRLAAQYRAQYIKSRAELIAAELIAAELLPDAVPTKAVVRETERTE